MSSRINVPLGDPNICPKYLPFPYWDGWGRLTYSDGTIFFLIGVSVLLISILALTLFFIKLGLPLI